MSVYYSSYLGLDKILDAQHPESFKEGAEPAHDEMLFIIIHQAYELWFKQILFELDSVRETMEQPALNDNSPELRTVVHRMQRVVTIFRVIVQQIDILETMTPMDFLEFRDRLHPASGFQSTQFKRIEATLGLKFDHRHGQSYYTSQLKPEDVAVIKKAEDQKSILELINGWLERMPFADDNSYWSEPAAKADAPSVFWQKYFDTYKEGLAEAEAANAESFQKIFFEDSPERSLSAKAARSALFIMLYRGYPMLEFPFQLLDMLIEIDNQAGSWRFRHINMVRRMIGTRIGTGGSTGAGYLQGAMDKHYIFKEISQLNSFLIDRKKLPALPDALRVKLGFA